MDIKKIRCCGVQTNRVAQGREMNAVIKHSVATQGGFFYQLLKGIFLSPLSEPLL